MKKKLSVLTLALLMSCYVFGSGTQPPQTDSLSVSLGAMREAVKIFEQRDYYHDLYRLNRTLNAACEAEVKRLRRERWLYGGCGVAVGLVVGIVVFK